jgi:hypothetical protein
VGVCRARRGRGGEGVSKGIEVVVEGVRGGGVLRAVVMVGAGAGCSPGRERVIILLLLLLFLLLLLLLLLLVGGGLVELLPVGCRRGCRGGSVQQRVKAPSPSSLAAAAADGCGCPRG